MLVEKLLFFVFGKERGSSCLFLACARPYVLVCGSVSGVLSHEAKVFHNICRMMRAVVSPYISARAGPLIEFKF